MLHKMMAAEDERREELCEILADEELCEILADLTENVRSVRRAMDDLILVTYRAENELPIGTLGEFWDAVRGTQDEIAELIVPG